MSKRLAFNSGMEWGEWREWEETNCDICAKGHIGIDRAGKQVDPTEEPWEHLLCDIEEAIDRNYWGYKIADSFFARLGFDSNGEPRQCGEFEARQEARDDHTAEAFVAEMWPSEYRVCVRLGDWVEWFGGEGDIRKMAR